MNVQIELEREEGRFLDVDSAAFELKASPHPRISGPVPETDSDALLLMPKVPQRTHSIRIGPIG